MSIYSSLHQEGKFTGGSTLQRQIIWIAICWLALIIFSFINYRYYFGLAYFVYFLNLTLLAGVYFFGKTAMGAQRWLSVGIITFQPSELSKVAIVIVLARLFALSEQKGFIRPFLFPFSLVLLNALIIFKQPDLGTALILIFLFFALAFSSRANKIYYISALLLGLIFSPLLLNSLKDYQRKRLVVFINPNVDPLGAGYTIIQSKIAIGSGQVFGKGFLAGTQNQFNFLPERHTDFIFTVIAEEWGFLGSLFLFLIYWLILKKILTKARGVRDSFGYFLCVGISWLFFIHVFINIGMTLGILPVVGLPLIFLSYGGSNLLAMFILVGVFFNICRNYK